MTALLSVYVAFALAIAVLGGWQIARWLLFGGRSPRRGRRGTASGFSNAALAMQALYNPAAKNAIELQVEEESRREEDGDADPPDPGSHELDQPRDS